MPWGYRASSYAASTGLFNAGGGANQRAVTEGAAVSSGDRVYAIVVLYPASGTATPGVPTVSDSINAGNYNLDDSATYTDGTTHVWAGVFSKANSGAGTPVVTCTAAETGDQGLVATFAYSGLLASDPGWDVRVHATGAGGTAASGTSGASSAANELVLGVYLDDGWSSGAISGAGAGYTQRGVTQSNSAGESQVQDQDSGASGGTYSSSLASGHPGGGAITWAEFCIVYKLAGGGGGSALTRTASFNVTPAFSLAEQSGFTRGESWSATPLFTMAEVSAFVRGVTWSTTPLFSIGRALGAVRASSWSTSFAATVDRLLTLTRGMSWSSGVQFTVQALRNGIPIAGNAILNQLRLRLQSGNDNDPGGWMDL